MSDELQNVSVGPTIKLELEDVPAPSPEMPTVGAVAQMNDQNGLLNNVSAAGVAVEAKPLDDSSLTPEERQQVEEFSKQIDITNANQVLQYGVKAQQGISNFSEAALDKVRTKDAGAIGDNLSRLVLELKSTSTGAEKPKGISGLFKKAGNQMDIMKIQYNSAEKNVDQIASILQNQQIGLMKDIALLDQMYDMNLSYFKELTMYILAGKKALVQATSDLDALRLKAQQSGLPEDAQAANDFANQINRFEKKIHDLELTRIISIQMAPQIRLIQNNDAAMVEKIQTSLVNTIPLWKNQMVLAISMSNNQRAIDSQRAVTDMTNELLTQNADALKMGTVQAAQESERSVVDIETLQHTNEQLITTLDEVVRIQEEGRAKRAQAEQEMAQIEGQLKDKLLQMRSEGNQIQPQ